MDIDGDVAVWILDFLLRRPIENVTLSTLLEVLPIPTEDLNLKKLLLLWKLDYELSRSSISESMLEWLEQLEEIEFRRGNEASNVMKRAYCLAAVDCTLRVLTNGEVDDKEKNFHLFIMVRRVWIKKIDRMNRILKEGSEKGGLGSDLLWRWNKDIQDALWNDECTSVLQKFDIAQATEALRDYLLEEREKMGPSFLEMMVYEGDHMNNSMQKLLVRDTVAEVETPRVGEAPDGSNIGKEKQKEKVRLGTTVKRARTALRKSLTELQEAVNDLLPEALRVAKAISKLIRAVEELERAKDNIGWCPNI